MPTTAYAVLGLLSVGEKHTAYDLKQRADRSIAHIYWAPAMSAIYTELGRLERLGHVIHELQAETETRSKRVYRITAEGIDALRSWIESGDHEPTVIKNTALLRVLFGAVTDTTSLSKRLDEHTGWARRQLDSLEGSLAAEQAPSTDSSAGQLSILVLEAAITALRAELEAAALIFSRLEQFQHKLN